MPKFLSSYGWLRFAFVITLACLPAAKAGADEAVRREFYFNTTSTDDGLAQNHISAILQDRVGYVWIAGTIGLQRYNGYQFDSLAHDDRDSGSLPEGQISALAEDDDGNLWIGTPTVGVLRRGAGQYRFERMPSWPDGHAPRQLTALLFDPRHGIWVGSEAGIALLDKNDGHLVRAWPLGDSPATHLFVNRLCIDADGILAATSAGLFRVTMDAAQASHLDVPDSTEMTDVRADSNGTIFASGSAGLYEIGATVKRIWPESDATGISAFAITGDGRFWIAVPHQGLAIFDRATMTTYWATPRNDVDGSMPDAVVGTIEIDRSGLLWLGTHERGVTRVDPRGTPFQLVLDRAGSGRTATAVNYIRALLADAGGGVWLASNGNALKRYDIAANRFDDYDAPVRARYDAGAAVEPLRVNALGDGGGGRIWIGANRGVILFDPQRDGNGARNSGVSNENAVLRVKAQSMIVARDGSLWIGTPGNGLVHHDPKTGNSQAFRVQANAETATLGGLGSDFVSVLHEDRDGRIWAGSDDGVSLLDPGTQHIRLIREQPGDTRSLAGRIVRAITESGDGTLWFATHNGLSRLDSLDNEQARFTRWQPRDGLPSATTLAVVDDARGRLWLATNHGIAALDRSSNAIRTFDMADGLQGMEFNGNAAAILDNGQIAFGGVGGLNLFKPQAVAGSRFPAPPVLTGARIGGEKIAPPHAGAALHMRYSDRVVQFEFAALDFSAPARNRFAYKLEGFDERWIEGGTRHDATYTHLDAGHYVFRVRASNHDGFWSENEATIGLDVEAAWWQSTAARLVYALLLALTLLSIWRAQSKRQRAEARHRADLQEREGRLRLALWGSGDEFWDWNIANDEFVLTGAKAFLGRDIGQSVARTQHWYRENVHPDDLPAFERRIDDHIARHTDAFESEHRLRAMRGNWIWVHARGRIVERDSDGQPLRMCGTLRDITVSRAADRDRRIAEEVIHNMAEAVTVSDHDFRFLTINPAFTRITGWREEEIIGQPITLLDDASQPAEVYLAVRATLAQTGHWRGELWQRRKDGEKFLSWIEISELLDAERTLFVSVTSDITDRKRSEQELRHMANYDALTGLPNRILMSARMALSIDRARAGDNRLALLFLDLDRFKHVNDSMGHAAGDRMLKAAGARLLEIVPSADSVARLGGDEFTVVLEPIVEAVDAERVAEKIIAAFEQPLLLDDGQEVVISPSIGISLFPDHGEIAVDLLKFADTAMYQAKERGRNTYMVYTESMDAIARLRATTVSALRKALERNEFSLVYQPRLSLLDERISGVEALLRWNSAELGEIPPGVFIPIAEETGLIIEIGDWVIANACAQLASWRDEGISEVAVSVNVSVAQLRHRDLIARLCEVIATHGIEPTQLELELTESMVMANAEQSITTLQRLKDVGVTLAIDDFGTGYSSLSYLKRLPIDTLKIDKEFVGDITTDPDDEAITATVIAMAHSLGLNVVAEGVESAEQVEYLREQDCDEIQGYWLSPPLPPDRCAQFLRERSARREVALRKKP